MKQAEPATPVPYAALGRASDTFHRSRVWSRDVAALLPGLRRAIEHAGLWILHEIDPQQLLLRDGHAIGPARQILFFHPRFVVRLLETDPAALLEAPLKFALFEPPDGPTILRWSDPALAFARYGHPDLAALGRELSALCDAIATEAIEEATRHAAS